MAGYRQFHTQFWKDEWVIELEPLERYLFSYLFTNDLSSISGIYKLPMRVIVNETGLDREFIQAIFAKFQEAKKIFYEEGVMWVVNMHKYHKNASPRTMTKVNADIREIPDGRVKTAYLYYEKTGEYCIDTVSIPRSESVSRIVSVKESVSVSENNQPPRADPKPDIDIFTLYQNEIGPLTPMISDALQAAEKDYPIQWFPSAFKEAADHNARNWKYIEAILRNWKDKGLGPLRPNSPPPKRDAEQERLAAARASIYGRQL